LYLVLGAGLWQDFVRIEVAAVTSGFQIVT